MGWGIDQAGELTTVLHSRYKVFYSTGFIVPVCVNLFLELYPESSKMVFDISSQLFYYLVTPTKFYTFNRSMGVFGSQGNVIFLDLQKAAMYT